MRDNCRREISELRLSVTDRCELACIYCRPAHIGTPHSAIRTPHSFPRNDLLSFEEIVAVTRRLVNRFGIRRVRITGGEPLMRRSICRLVEMLAELGLDDLAMTTNGQRLGTLAQDLARAGLRRLNVSLDSLDPVQFRRISRTGDLQLTLMGLEEAKRARLWPIKLNTVVLRSRNDEEVYRLTEFALANGYEIRFLELMAVGVAAKEHGRFFVPTSEVMERLCQHFVLEPLESVPGETARKYLAYSPRGTTGVVGFVSPESDPFCRECSRLRLSARGVLFGCLMQEEGVPLKPFLRSGSPIDEEMFDERVAEAIRLKPLGRMSRSPVLMSSIGG